jgi:hypothetical protein
MNELLGSQVKEDILLCLGLRGGCKGRQIARLIHKSPTPVFKAIHQLEKARIITKHGPPFFYSLNPYYIYHDELMHMIWKRIEKRTSLPFYPEIAPERRVDPCAIYDLLTYRESKIPVQKFSDTLRKRYA